MWAHAGLLKLMRCLQSWEPRSSRGRQDVSQLLTQSTDTGAEWSIKVCCGCFFFFFSFQKMHKNPRKMIVLLWLRLHCSSCYILLLLDFIYGPNYTWNQVAHAKKINIGDKHKHRRVDFLVLYVCRYGILLLPCRQTEEYSFFCFGLFWFVFFYRTDILRFLHCPSTAQSSPWTSARGGFALNWQLEAAEFMTTCQVCLLCVCVCALCVCVCVYIASAFVSISKCEKPVCVWL